MRYVRFVNRKLALAMVTCLPPLQGSDNVLLQLLIFNTPWKQFRLESRNEDPCALGKTGGTSLQIFSGVKFIRPILVSPGI